MKELVYLDNAATTYPKPEVVYEKMDFYTRNLSFNAGRGGYKAAKEAANLIDELRQSLSKLVSLQDYNRLILTPSATHALNQIILGLDWDSTRTVYVSPYEHNAVMRPLHYIKKKYDIRIEYIPLKEETKEIDLDKLRACYNNYYPDYVFITHVSNVTGYILPIEDIVNLSLEYNAKVTIDCSQSMGLIPINVNNVRAHYYVFAGHKTLYGPFGIGGYIDMSPEPLNEVITGGTGSNSLDLEMPKHYPHKYETSSFNITAIAGLKAALDWILEIGVDNIYRKEKELTHYLVKKISSIEDVVLYLPPSKQHISIVSFNLENFSSSDIGEILDEDFRIAVRTGYNCTPIIHNLLKSKEYEGVVRVSIGFFNSITDVDYFIDSLMAICTNE